MLCISLLVAAVCAGCSLDDGVGNCSIRGRIVDSAGSPGPFAAVSAMRMSDLGTPVATVGVMANAGGEYCIISSSRERGPVPAGRYRIRAASRNRPPSANPSCTSCCQPSTDFIATESEPVFLAAPGQPITVDIRLHRAPVYCVRGEVRGSAGALIDGGALTLTSEDRTETSGVILEGGRFLLTALPHGVYVLSLTEGSGIAGKTIAERRFEIRGRNIDRLLLIVPGARANKKAGALAPAWRGRCQRHRLNPTVAKPRREVSVGVSLVPPLARGAPGSF